LLLRTALSKVPQGIDDMPLALDERTITDSLKEIGSVTLSRPVSSDPLTAELKPTSNSETRAQRGTIRRSSRNVVLLKLIEAMSTDG
jgi:type IV secretory pathway protease TraF